MTEAGRPDISSIEAVEAGLIGANYICNRQTATAIYLAHHLRKPVLVEGPAGVGKTELARATAHYLGLPLVRMQCYEGLDESKALYEWKYGKQLLYTQILKDTFGASLRGIATMGEALEKIADFDDVFFSEQFLEARPLLAALRQENGAVLLVDEVDKSDQEFEAFLLEILSDYQVTIPEIGTISATVPPVVILTSNDSRDLGDALKRRCLHLHIGYPDAKLEERIIDVRVPGVEERLRSQLVAFVQRMRTFELKKLPSVSETIDWARALVLLHVTELDGDAVRDTLNILLKYESDIESMKRHVSSIVGAVN
ncbi:MAG: MoxR family ATPase [Candidatus Eremiobacteraeota bacterium]|nr:MoxR family ATPase [Candidatus Eremiobacteraeota bacterium]